MRKDFIGKLNEYRAASRLVFSEEYPLSSACTFRIGGPADFAVGPLDCEALSGVVSSAADNGIRYLVCGNASNILFDDLGYRGAVVFTSKLRDISLDGNTLSCGAGVGLSALSSAARDASLEGLEFAYGIPGTVGGAIYMNAGAYGGEISQVLSESLYYDPVSRKTGTLSAAEHEFSYRRSVYEGSGKLILGAKFTLKTGDVTAIRAKMEKNQRARSDKQPLEYPSAGSVFKRYPGFYTAALIDKAGLKGTYSGGEQISEKHAGFIVNRGGATSEDVRRLISLASYKIKEDDGIDIECEIKYIAP